MSGIQAGFIKVPESSITAFVPCVFTLFLCNQLLYSLGSEGMGRSLLAYSLTAGSQTKG
jgi:hypothetical protein